MLKSTFGAFQKKLSKHLFAILQLYDPIISRFDSNDDTNHQSLSKQSLFYFSTFFIFAIESVGILGLEFDAVGFNFSCSSLATSPHIVMHQLMPPEVWTHIDPHFFIGINGALLTAAVLYSSQTLMMIINENFRFSVESENNCLKSKKIKLDKQQFLAILSYRGNIHRYFYPATVVFEAVLLSFFYLMVYLNGHYRWSVVSVVYWFVVLPVGVFYIFICKLERDDLKTCFYQKKFFLQSSICNAHHHDHFHCGRFVAAKKGAEADGRAEFEYIFKE